MNLAYFLLVHRDPEQFRWLWRAIGNSSDCFCIHVDAKSPDSFDAEVRRVVGAAPNVRWLPRRKIAWSGWSMVAAELDAMRLMLSERGSLPPWRHWINLSGQDYPIKPMESIRRTLAAGGDRNHIRCWTFDRVAVDEPDDIHLRRRAYLEYRGKIRRVPLLRLPGSRNLDWKGSTWHMLAREFCEWAVDSEFARRPPAALRFAFCPDELFFQALIMSSGFAPTVDQDFGRLVLWPGPKVLGVGDLPCIRSSPCLFARKFDHARDADVLREIAAECGHGSP